MKENVVKILFVIGIIIVLVILAFAIIKFVPKIFSSLGSIGTNITQTVLPDKITVKASDESPATKVPVAISWEYKPEKAGEFSISHNCVDDFSLTVQTVRGNTRLICDRALVLGSDIKTIQVIPEVSKKDSFVDAVVTIAYFEEGATEAKASGTATLTVRNSDNGDGTDDAVIISEPKTDTNTSKDDTKKVTTTPSYVAPAPYIPSGPADLAIVSITGLPNQSAFQFTVTNIGGRASGNWYFTYTTPANPSETLTSPLQQSLSYGESLIITVRYGYQNVSRATVTVYVDPQNLISESSNSNNVATVSVTGSTGSSNNNDNDNDDDFSSSGDDPDLEIRNLEVGYMDGSRFVEDDTIDSNDDAAIRFDVYNRGDDDSGRFEYEVDTSDDVITKTVSSLDEGDHRTITVEFDIDNDSDDLDIEVELDPDDDIDEENENNNSDDIRLEVR